MNQSPQASVSLLAIEGECTIYTAAEHCVRLQERLAESAELDLDLSAVSEIDSAGIQLLLWAAQTAAGLGGRLRVCGQSETVVAAARLLQLEALHGADEEGAA